MFVTILGRPGAGKTTLELRPYALTVNDPADCLILSAVRQPSIVYAVAQWLWVMRGSDDVEEIGFYNDRAKAFSNDGLRLAGAFGARMRRPRDQLRASLELLQRDPATRRALIVISRPDDLIEPTRDHACAESLHLFLRAGRLEAITTMRSQSALMVFPYDAALFMTIHVWAAAALGVPCGPHTWLANSMHLYEDEIDLAHAVLTEPLSSVRLPPVTDADASIANLQQIEMNLRIAVLSDEGLRSQRLGVGRLAAMHRAFAHVLLVHAGMRLGDSETVHSSLGALPAPWKEACELWLASRQPVRS